MGSVNKIQIFVLLKKKKKRLLNYNFFGLCPFRQCYDVVYVIIIIINIIARIAHNYYFCRQILSTMQSLDKMHLRS